jgi:hypothetical protein
MAMRRISWIDQLMRNNVFAWRSIFLGDSEPLRIPVHETTLDELAMTNLPAFLNVNTRTAQRYHDIPTLFLGFLQELRAKG